MRIVALTGFQFAVNSEVMPRRLGTTLMLSLGLLWACAMGGCRKRLAPMTASPMLRILST